jgi:hypothetical protein
MSFGTQIIGQTENALNAILDRELDGTGLTEPQWVTLSIAVASGGSVESAALANRVATALKISDAQARKRIDELAAAGLLTAGTGAPAARVTNAGNQLHGRVRAAITDITDSGAISRRRIERRRGECWRPFSSGQMPSWLEAEMRGVLRGALGALERDELSSHA